MACGCVFEFLRGDLVFFGEIRFNGVILWNESRDHLIVYNLIMNDVCFKEQDDSTHHELKRKSIIKKIPTSKSLLHIHLISCFRTNINLIWFGSSFLTFPRGVGLDSEWLGDLMAGDEANQPDCHPKNWSFIGTCPGFSVSLYRKPLIAIRITAVFAVVAKIFSKIFWLNSKKSPPSHGFSGLSNAKFSKDSGSEIAWSKDIREVPTELRNPKKKHHSRRPCFMNLW